MTVLRILQEGAPELRRVSEPVDLFDDALDAFTRDMLETMFGARGVGLAAPQVGRCQRVIVAGIDGPRGGTWTLVNPFITRRSAATQTSVEGCLSVRPRYWNQPVSRALRVWVEYRDTVGRPHEMKARGLLAAVIQHEVDHLDGVLFTDYARLSTAAKAVS